MAEASVGLDLDAIKQPDVGRSDRPTLNCSHCGDGMKALRSNVGIAPEHLPVFVSRDERNLLDREASLKQPACRLMAKIMKMQIMDL
jgi:hypothetical protein